MLFEGVKLELCTFAGKVGGKGQKRGKNRFPPDSYIITVISLRIVENSTCADVILPTGSGSIFFLFLLFFHIIFYFLFSIFLPILFRFTVF